MNKKIIMPIFFIIVIFIFQLVQASPPLYVNYEIIRIKSIDFNNINLLEKNVNDIIPMHFFDNHFLECKVKRINDMYDIRQIRCAPSCWPVKSFSKDCIPVTGESGYFVFSVNLDNSDVIRGNIHIGDRAYEIKTCLNDKEIYSRGYKPDLNQNIYSYILIENVVKDSYEYELPANACEKFQQHQIMIDPIENPIKCVFQNSDTEQECSPSSHGIGCTGINNCDAKIIYWGADFPEHNIISDKGKKIVWSSSCGEVSMIIGEHNWGEEIIFDCQEEKISFFQNILNFFKRIFR